MGGLGLLHDLRFHPQHWHQSEAFPPEGSDDDVSGATWSEMIEPM
jgi:hypothetical protein